MADGSDKSTPVVAAINAATEPDDDELLSHAPAHSDESLALEFAERHAADLRYLALWGKWLRYDGAVWRVDKTLHAFDLARRICREAARECNSNRTAKTLASAKTVAAVERLAKADRRLAASIDQWDADPLLLNTPDGVVDLRTGELRAHRADDFMMKMTAVGPALAADCPRWRKFLHTITNGDADVEAFLQRVAGYCLTGLVSEHALFFGYGGGNNGKGVFLHTVGNILGDYHTSTPIETFTASMVDRHPTELADLWGARLVTSSETEEGRRWAESRIKGLTGGDRVKARFMRQDFFEYDPQFKIFVTGNNKPGLRSVDEAIRRRMNLIPFDVVIPKADRDKGLEDKLKDEWPGILRWMIEGVLSWQRDGLRQPKAVIDATGSYLASEDTFQSWLEDCCVIEKVAWTKFDTLYSCYAQWAKHNNEFVLSGRKFAIKLDDLGFANEKVKEVRGRRGIGMNGWKEPM